MIPNLTKLFLVLCCFICCQTLSAQKVMKNTNGEIIVQYQDGSWRYYDPKDTSDIKLLEEQNRRVKERNAAKLQKDRIVERTSDSKNKKANKVKAQKSKKTSNKKSKKKRIASSKSNKSKKSKSKKFKDKKSKNPKLAKKKSSKFKTNYPSGTDFNDMATKIIVDSNSKKVKVKEEERKALFQKNILDDKLKRAKKNKAGKMELQSLSAKLKAAKTNLKGLKKSRSILDKKRRSYAAIIDKEPLEQERMFVKLDKKFGSASSASSNAASQSKLSLNRKKNKTNKTVGNIDAGARTTRNNNTSNMPWPKKVDFSKNPPSSLCAVAFQGVDDFSGKRRKDLFPKKFFSYTDERMAKFFPEGDMVECKAHLSIVSGGLTFLSTEIVINSESAKTSYGSLEKGTLLTLKLVNGENINLTNNKSDVGLLDPIAKTVTYKTQYLVPSQHIKTLQKNEVDLLRLVWGTGYEDYFIYETDFFIDQLKCLLE